MSGGGLTVRDVYETLTKSQKDYLHFLVGYALNHGSEKARLVASYSGGFDGFSYVQRKVSQYILSEATKLR